MKTAGTVDCKSKTHAAQLLFFIFSSAGTNLNYKTLSSHYLWKPMLLSSGSLSAELSLLVVNEEIFILSLEGKAKPMLNALVPHLR